MLRENDRPNNIIIPDKQFIRNIYTRVDLTKMYFNKNLTS